MKYFVVIFFFTSFIQKTVAGDKTIVIRDLNAEYGFTKGRVNCVTQDSQGVIWFGMINGLCKFDQNSFKRFTLKNNSGFPQVPVNAIIEIAPGNLMVGTKNGLFLLNTYKEIFDTVNCNSEISLSNIQVQSLYKEDSISFWIGSDMGLMNIKLSGYDEGKIKFKFEKWFNVLNTNIKSNNILEIIENRNQDLWFLTFSELCSYSPVNDSIKRFELTGANSSIWADKENILVSKFDDGLKIFDTRDEQFGSDSFSSGLVDSKLKYLFKDSKNRYWVSISNLGVLLMDSLNQKTEAILLSNKDEAYRSLNSNVVYRIYEAKDGSIWFCTEKGLVLVSVKENLFTNYSIPDEHNSTIGIRSIYKGKDDKIWLGTVGQGLYCARKLNGRVHKVPLSLNGRPIGSVIQAITEDSDGSLWLGTEGDGIIKLTFGDSSLNPISIINYRYHPNPFPKYSILNDYIMCLLEDKNSNIWVGTWYGLSLYKHSEPNTNKEKPKGFENFLSNSEDEFALQKNVIMSLAEDSERNVWAGSQAGISKITPTDSGYIFTSDFFSTSGRSIANKNILDVLLDDKNGIWFSSLDGGICLLDPQTGIYEEFNSSNGFHDSRVNSISQDSSGILWLGTTDGVCRYNPVLKTFKMYNTEDGILSNDFLFKASCWVDNKLILGNTLGISIFDPNEIDQPEFDHNLVFTNFKLFNKEANIGASKSPLITHISKTKEVILSHDENYITIEFAVLNYIHERDIQYTCILEGLESSWNELHRQRKKTYTSLQPGDYIFKVRTKVDGNSRDQSEINLIITIKPPLWKSKIAYAVYIVFTLIIISLGYRFFLHQERKKYELNMEKMNAKRIHEMDMLKLQFYTNISHELRTPLTLISSPLDALMNKKLEQTKISSYYRLIHKNVQRLLSLIDQLLDMRKLEEGHLKLELSQGDIIEFSKRLFANFEAHAEKRNIKYSYEVPKQPILSYFDADKLEKVILNLLSNAFKYTPDSGEVNVQFNLEEPKGLPETKKRYYSISFTDTGYGIPKSSIKDIFKPYYQVKQNLSATIAGSGIGLSLTKELIEIQSGTIAVQSEEGKGTCFTITLPIITEKPEGSLTKTPELAIIKTIDRNVQTAKIEKTSTSVLLVEDDNDLKEFISSELSNYYIVLNASNGREGLNTAIENIPDIIISDVMMEELDGIEMCKQLKTDIRTSHIPVILLTARYADDIKLKSYEIGADDYITKPFKISLLQAKISNLIDQRRKLRRLFAENKNLDFSEIATNKTDEIFIEKVNEAINKNMNNLNFNPSLLASEMAMSKMQLYRKVAALTNQTVYNYIRTIKMNKAAQLLVSTNMQVSEIAYKVGFSEASNFSNAFSKYYKCTPTQYIKKNKK
ncbi:hybrid sensor histidine kinase/response regulator transcription factor [Draconibacterium mangrovi]|uniref:hybrid sensor histidine kinase/response regulator transcription factor n=1 Tax=Draconibacterium mangrovi TaxID=2697469 RepID=UPI0013D40D8D|nr:hybrid sensor histidine kinase/response regulator transcription factor [Draconibacterium mangrovi]